jgi:hypothetical protein
MFKDNPDFYPTPISLQRKMFSKLDFTKIRSVLEPSAGKCDLVEGIKKQFELTQRYRHTKKYDIDTIEISPELQHIIKGKGYRLVHDDFLSYNSYKKYDVIIANFPFSAGDKHLLHAIKMQEQGGIVVALINADTLRNPYSNTRKELIRQLEKYNAEVEYIENAFVDSERSTGVTVALVTVKFEKVPYDSVILDELKKEEIHRVNEYNSNHIIESDFIKGIVSQYEYEIKAGLKLIEEYNALKPFMLRTFNGNGDNAVLKLELDYKDNEGSTLENAYIKQIRAKYCQHRFIFPHFQRLKNPQFQRSTLYRLNTSPLFFS